MQERPGGASALPCRFCVIYQFAHTETRSRDQCLTRLEGPTSLPTPLQRESVAYCVRSFHLRRL